MWVFKIEKLSVILRCFYITNTCACVQSLTWFVCFSIIIEALLNGFNPDISFLRCKCTTILCARTQRNAMRRSIEICLFIWVEKTFMNSLQLYEQVNLILYLICNKNPLIFMICGTTNQPNTIRSFTDFCK